MAEIKPIQKYTVYFIGGRKELIYGPTLVTAIMNSNIPESEWHALEYWAPGEDSTFTMKYNEKEDVHSWTLNNAQQLYTQIMNQNIELFAATKEITKYKNYMEQVFNIIKYYLEHKLPETEVQLKSIVQTFFTGLAKMKSESENNKVDMPLTKEDYDKIKKRYGIESN